MRLIFCGGVLFGHFGAAIGVTRGNRLDYYATLAMRPLGALLSDCLPTVTAGDPLNGQRDVFSIIELAWRFAHKFYGVPGLRALFGIGMGASGGSALRWRWISSDSGCAEF